MGRDIGPRPLARSPGWRVVGASVVGASHAVSLTPCHDYSAKDVVDTPSGPVALLAIADGAGTASASYHGARTAVQAAFTLLIETLRLGGFAALSLDLLKFIIAVARDAVLETAANHDRRVRDYASTLLVAVAGPERTLVAHIGDGAIVADDGALRVLTWPQQGEYANSTHFLIEDDALKLTRFIETGPARRLALLSDGLQALALEYASQTAFAPFFEPCFSYLETSPKSDEEIEAQLETYLESTSINARTDDDKSLVLAVRR
jgi:hypothetical protein